MFSSVSHFSKTSYRIARKAAEVSQFHSFANIIRQQRHTTSSRKYLFKFSPEYALDQKQCSFSVALVAACWCTFRALEDTGELQRLLEVKFFRFLVAMNSCKCNCSRKEETHNNKQKRTLLILYNLQPRRAKKCSLPSHALCFTDILFSLPLRVHLIYLKYLADDRKFLLALLWLRHSLVERAL